MPENVRPWTYAFPGKLGTNDDHCDFPVSDPSGELICHIHRHLSEGSIIDMNHNV